jgi:hypothetical protein
MWLSTFACLPQEPGIRIRKRLRKASESFNPTSAASLRQSAAAANRRCREPTRRVASMLAPALRVRCHCAPPSFDGRRQRAWASPRSIRLPPHRRRGPDKLVRRRHTGSSLAPTMRRTGADSTSTTLTNRVAYYLCSVPARVDSEQHHISAAPSVKL